MATVQTHQSTDLRLRDGVKKLNINLKIKCSFQSFYVDRGRHRKEAAERPKIKLRSCRITENKTSLIFYIFRQQLWVEVEQSFSFCLVAIRPQFVQKWWRRRCENVEIATKSSKSLKE